MVKKIDKKTILKTGNIIKNSSKQAFSRPEDVDIKKLLGLRIKEVRKMRHMTQEQLAELVGIECNNVCRIENGKNYPTPENLSKFASALNIDVHELFLFKHHESIEKIRTTVITEVQRDDHMARLMFKFYQAVR